MTRNLAFLATIFLAGCGGAVDPIVNGDEQPVYPASDEPTAPGVEALISLGDDPDGLECSSGGVYWFDAAARRIVRFDNGEAHLVLDVDVDGAVVLRSSGDHVVAAALGESGRVWLIGQDGTPTEVHAGRVDAVASHGGEAWWYDGAEIRGSADARAFPAESLVDLAANANGPAWFDESGTLRVVRNGGVAEAFRDFVGLYPGTLRGVDDVLTWGSESGAKVLPEDTGIIISRERDVDNIGVGDGTITFCEHIFGAVKNVFAMKPRGEAESIADHETCVETVRCGAHVYWTTERGSLLRAPLPKMID